MIPIQFNIPTGPARHAKPGIDVQVSDLARMVQAGEVSSCIACQHLDAPLPDLWFVYVMGQAAGGQACKCLGIVCLYADRPLAMDSLDAVVELMQDIGFDGLLTVCAEPVPVGGL